MLSACHISGSEGRRRGDSLRNLFAPQLQSDERNFKNHWFLAAFFPPISSAAGRNGAAGGAEPRGRGRTPPLCGCPEFYSFRGPACRTHTCRRWRQVRDLIIAQTGGRPLLSACHVSGSEGRRRGDSLRTFLHRNCNRTKGIPKTIGFWRRSFPHFFRRWKKWGRRRHRREKPAGHCGQK